MLSKHLYRANDYFIIYASLIFLKVEDFMRYKLPLLLVIAT